MNLGSPSAPEPGPVARYLKDFLSDRRVIDLPRWFWLPLLYLVIAPIRGRKSARAYRKIWTDQGSPLVVLTEALAAALREELASQDSPPVIATGMRYGEPSTAHALQSLDRAGIEKLIVLPLYPQYSGTTTESAFDAVKHYYRSSDAAPEIHYREHYYQHPAWTAAIAESIRVWRAGHGSAELLMFSFHGLPERYIAQGDPYRDQCLESVRNITNALELSEQDYVLSFQSRVGAEKWLQPYTDKELERLAAAGVKRVQVVCPGFAIDCLETLEEIAMQNRELFLAAGGEVLEYIPALNASPAHVQVMQALIAG
jgi:ferrochelatase